MGNNTGIEAPPDVLAGLDAGKRPAVVVSVFSLMKFSIRVCGLLLAGAYP